MLAVESLLFAAVGAVAGIALGALTLDLLLGLRPPDVPRIDNVTLDGAVLGFTLAVTLFATLLFGLAPGFMAAFRNGARNVASARITTTRKRQRLSRALVVAEVAVSLVLLIGAALLTSSLRELHNVQPGFDAKNVLTFSISLPGTQYERPEGTDRFFRRFEDAIEALPGVVSAAVVWPLPLAGRSWANQYIAGAVDEGQRRYALYRLATPDLFETMRIPMRAGRTFGASDKRHVVIVSARFADTAWPGQSAVGRQVRANPWGGGLEDFEVIGVVEDVHSRNLRESPQETIYLDSHGWSRTDWEVDYVVRTAGSPDALVPTIRETLASLDPSIPLARLSSMQAYVDRQLGSNEFALALLGLFAVVAAALAVIGLYGVVSHGVAERSHEIGVRMALGAERRRILSSVLAQGALLMAFGVTLGMAGAFVSTHWLASLLFVVTPLDPATFAYVALALAIVGILACLGPARRATRLDPLTVLKTD